MKRITFSENNRSDNLLHIEVPGAIINIRVNLTDNLGRKVTAIAILPEDETRSPDGDGYYWRLAADGSNRVIRDIEPGMHYPDAEPEENEDDDRKDGIDDRYVKRLMGIPQYGDDEPAGVAQAIADLVSYNWADEERDYNTEALAEGNSREGHVFGSLMTIQRWLETIYGYPHVEPRIEPDTD